jgi:hypothetical protein
MRRKKRKAKKENIEKIPIVQEAARDEGPRLIPFAPPRSPRDEHYFKRILELADVALKKGNRGEEPE